MFSQWRIQDFPEEKVPTPGGHQYTILPKFPQKLHEIERIWTRGHASLVPPLNPLLIHPHPGVFKTYIQKNSFFKFISTSKYHHSQ